MEHVPGGMRTATEPPHLFTVAMIDKLFGHMPHTCKLLKQAWVDTRSNNIRYAIRLECVKEVAKQEA